MSDLPLQDVVDYVAAALDALYLYRADNPSNRHLSAVVVDLRKAQEHLAQARVGAR